jgi:hypothetical protein
MSHKNKKSKNQSSDSDSDSASSNRSDNDDEEKLHEPINKNESGDNTISTEEDEALTRSYESFMSSRSEVATIISLLKIDILRDKPDDIAKYASTIFFNSKNKPKLESILRMKLR